MPRLNHGECIKFESLAEKNLLTTLAQICPCVLHGKFIYVSTELIAVDKILLEGYKSVCVTGPKGCGKSFILCVLFLKWQAHSPCLYLSVNSFRNPTLFLRFLNEHQKAFKKNYEKYYQTFSASGIVQSKDVVNFIMDFLEYVEEMYLFVDVGSVTGSVCDLQGFVDIIQIFSDGKLTKIFSVSSGFVSAQTSVILNRVDRECCYNIQGLLDSCFDKVVVNGFTDAEVNKFIECFNKNIDVDKIKEAAGNNPLLLSCLARANANNFESYLKHVNREVNKFLFDNLTVISNPGTFAEFFRHKKWETGRLYILLAMQLQGRKFTDEQVKQFEMTWLYEQQILIKTSTNCMKFNFPTLGPALVDSFRRLLTPLPTVQQLAYTNDSVMGFVFEQRFMDHCNREEKLNVMISRLGEEGVEYENLYICTVRQFDGSNLVWNTLHDLCCSHEAVDLVGYVQSISTSQCFLVFLQLSLSKYTGHKGKLNDLIRTAPKKMYVNEASEQQLNNLEFFSLRASHLYPTDDKPNVLLMYISPKENKDCIVTLQNNLKNEFSRYIGCFNFFVGILPPDSPVFQTIKI